MRFIAHFNIENLSIIVHVCVITSEVSHSFLNFQEILVFVSEKRIAEKISYVYFFVEMICGAMNFIKSIFSRLTHNHRAKLVKFLENLGPKNTLTKVSKL